MTGKPTGSHKEFFIQGMTQSGKEFRPSDWADRLCGVMARFVPDEDADGASHLQYSPYVRPIVVGGLRCVVVDERLNDIEPMAYNFLLNFARDNDLVAVAACSLPDPPKKN
ncbi:MAG: DUF3579 domain-containing protein [Burkholderiales bacterium]|jgi:hypothetical protein|nr:DUF3579 domain-containing protein [Burkholderiales bacterium]